MTDPRLKQPSRPTDHLLEQLPDPRNPGIQLADLWHWRSAQPKLGHGQRTAVPEWNTAWTIGRSLSWEQAADEALVLLDG